MSDAGRPGEFSLVVVRTTAPRRLAYSLEEAACLAGIHPELLRYYCQLGLLGEARSRPEIELRFDDDALYELRRFEDYRRHHGVGRKALRLIVGLRQEVDRLQAELRFRRAQG